MDNSEVSLRASIDIGSNSVLLLIGHFEEDRFKEKCKKEEVTGLGTGLDKNKKFSAGPMQETFKVLTRYREEITKNGIRPEEALVTATEASRVAENAPEFFERVKRELGLEVRIITPQAEAYFSALGVGLGLGPQKSESKLVHIIDVGGASTEIIKISPTPFSYLNSISLPIGSVRALDILQSGDWERSIEKIIWSKRKTLLPYRCDQVVAIAGTMTSLANLILGHKEYKDANVHNEVIELPKLEKFVKLYEHKNSEEVLAEFPFLGKRAKTILSGAKVALEMAKVLEVRSFKISTYGLRYGTLFEGIIKDEFISR